MASDLLILPLRLIRSAPGQKAEAKLVNSFHWECSQGRAEMRGHEVACLPGETGLHMGQSQRRASPFLAKSVLSAYFSTGLGGAYAVSVAPMALVLPAITSSKRFVRPTDEVPRRLDSGRVSVDYKSYTNGQRHASVTGTVSLRPRLQGCQQRQSKSSPTESQNRRKSAMVLGCMGKVSRDDSSHKMASPYLLWATQPAAKKRPLTTSDSRDRQSVNLENPTDYHLSVLFLEWAGSRASWVLTSGVLGVVCLSTALRSCTCFGRPRGRTTRFGQTVDGRWVRRHFTLTLAHSRPPADFAGSGPVLVCGRDSVLGFPFGGKLCGVARSEKDARRPNMENRLHCDNGEGVAGPSLPLTH